MTADILYHVVCVHQFSVEVLLRLSWNFYYYVKTNLCCVLVLYTDVDTVQC